MRSKKILVALLALLMSLVVMAPAQATGGGSDKITLCHANQGNGWSKIRVDKDAIVGFGNNKHDSHSGDIIPSFTYWFINWNTYPGKNLSTTYDWGYTGADVLANGCEVPDRPVPEQPDDIVVVQDWTDLPSCEAPTTLVGTVTSTTTWTFNEESWIWVEGETTVVDTRVETSLTEAELAECDDDPETPEEPEEPVVPEPPAPPARPVTTQPSFTG